jgi:hypothetical protein
MLGLSLVTVHRNWKRWPFAAKPGPKTLRFSRSGIYEWLKTQGGAKP